MQEIRRRSFSEHLLGDFESRGRGGSQHKKNAGQVYVWRGRGCYEWGGVQAMGNKT